MRVCLEKATGKLIEMQSHATPGTLIQNAISAGYAETDVEEKEVTESEWQDILDAQPKPEPQPTEADYLIDFDYRLSMIELGL